MAPGDGRFSLILGDPEHCPAEAQLAPERACPGLAGTACTYAEGRFGLSWFGPVTCFCLADDVDAGADGTWLCVSTDDEGRTRCPLEYPPVGAACTPPTVCLYGLPFAVASCPCSAQGELLSCGL